MDPDLELAIKLHNEWNNDSCISPKSPAKRRKKENVKKEGIVDSEWEITDPNPDIHTLFQVFDKKYFWGRLDCVEVKWSPRMYSCAGICTYKGKWGGCVISLSLPLLKLRPRKDLVETLLHEMIHAYLFVADRNRDRGEHGPKFHEHMFRINKEAGTKITVYHTFHDEVKFYKQHWWRCNGPCQSQKPFFGLVKRSMNRAPGPNDFWFAEHQSRCGGEFIKVREPEGFKSRKRGANKSKDSSKATGLSSPLEKYFPDLTNKKSLPNVSKTGKPKKCPKDNTNIKKGSPHKPGSQANNLDNYFSDSDQKHAGSFNTKDSMIKSVNNDNTSAKINKYKKISNVHGFTNLSKPVSSSINTQPKKTTGFGGTGLKSNMGGTLLLNPKTAISTISSLKNEEQDTLKTSSRGGIVPFMGSGHVLGGSSGSAPDKYKSKLLSLYSNNNNNNNNILTPSPSAIDLPSTSESTLKRNSVEIYEIPDSDDEGDNIVHCPVCNKSMPEGMINDHLESCIDLDSVFESTSQVLDEDTEVIEDNVPQDSFPDSVNCPVCGQLSSHQEINKHLDQCLN